MKAQKDYWDKKIRIWSNSSYKRKGEGWNLLEWIAGFFRGPIVGRMEIALKIIGPKLKGKIIADFGCGVGDFCFNVLRYHPQKVIGIDISQVAIQEAQKRAKEKGVENRVEFIQSDIGSKDRFPKFDIAVGLGFIDYLDKKELTHLFAKLRGRYFFFSFPEKKISLVNLLHSLYLKSQKCPGAFKYTKEEIKEIIPSRENPYFITEDKMLFVTNIKS